MRKHSRFWALTLAVAMGVTAVPVTAQAETVDPNNAESSKSDINMKDYELAWSDEFEGDSLNRDDWNVELHEAGWVNAELQEYVDSDENIKVEDGKLNIYPKQHVEEISNVPGNLLTNPNFSEGEDGLEGWATTIANWDGDVHADATITPSKGGVLLDIKDAGEDVWHVQMKNEIALESGKTYRVSFKVLSSIDRNFVVGVQSKGYANYGEQTVSAVANEAQNVSFEFTMENDDPIADFFISAGSKDVTYDPHTLAISNLVIVDPNAKVEVLQNNDFSNGKDGWIETIANWDASVHAVASSTTDGNAIIYTIDDAGDEDWNIQLKQGLSLKAGKEYTVKYNVTSSIDRQIKSGVMNAAYKWYGGSDPELEADVATPIEFTFTPGVDDDTASFYISAGNLVVDGETTAYDPHTITISDISVSTELDSVEPDVVTSYTSGRVSTQDKQTFTYGLFECRAKVPTGAGYLPAFWLMANDENVYGQWPRCGEIDCMEVMGHETDKLYGTIHYGNPKGSKQGTYVCGEEADFASEYHTYATEWEPGKITWYIDGKKYYETSDWYSATEGQGTLSYPAPFDQPFYVILNLAIGGEWVGYPDENTTYDDQVYSIDYVRVYQKDPECYDEDVTPPEVDESKLREPDEDGNYIVNGTFDAKDEDLTDDKTWKFMTAQNGEATATVSNNDMTVETTAAGDVDYSVQLVQADIPLVEGAEYEITFDAYADEERTMNVDVKAPDRNYAPCMDTFNPQLTTESQKFTTTFVYDGKTDANTRLEFNMGHFASTATIYIDNVTFKKVADPLPKEFVKTVLANGNYIYNGSFDEGTNHLGYWTVNKGSSKTTATVNSWQEGRQLVIKGATNPVTITQDGLTYDRKKMHSFTFEAKSDQPATALVNIGNHIYKTEIEPSEAMKQYKVSVGEGETVGGFVSISLMGEGTIVIDNIRLATANLITNGNLDEGKLGFVYWADPTASATWDVAEDDEDNNELVMNVTNTGDADYKIQIKQENIKLEKGKEYCLEFDAKSTVDRDLRVLMQGHLGTAPNDSWPVYSAEAKNVISLTDEYKHFTNDFVMNDDTDAKAFLSICYGAVDREITDEHTVTIDNISLVEIVDSDAESDDIIIEGLDSSFWIAKSSLVDRVYTGSKIKPAIKLYEDDTLLVKDKDYTLSFENNKEVGTATVVANGIGNYKGELARENFEIIPKDITAQLEAAANKAVKVVAVKSTAQKPALKVKVGDVTLVEGTDYVISTDSEEVLNPGEYAFTIEAQGKYEGSAELVFTITDKTPLTKLTVKKVSDKKYTGEEITQSPEIYKGTKKLKKDRDYAITYENNVEPGTATMIITGIGNYEGKQAVDFKIKGKSIADYKVKGISASYTYTGAAIKPIMDVRKTATAEPLVKGTDYVVEYKNNVKKGTATVTIKGIGYYAGSIKKTFDIKPVDLKANRANLRVKYTESVAYVGKTKTDITVVYGNKTLRPGTDYTVVYDNNTKITSSAKFYIKGKGSYTGTSATYKFAITPCNLKLVATVTAKDKKASSKAGESLSAPTVKAFGKTLVKGTDYTVKYYYNDDVAEVATKVDGVKQTVARHEGDEVGKYDVIPSKADICVVVTGKGKYTGDAYAIYHVGKKSLADKSVVAKVRSEVVREYDTNEQFISEDDLVITYGSKKVELTADDFEIVGYTKNINAGSAYAIVEGKGDYYGTIKVKFKILPYDVDGGL